MTVIVTLDMYSGRPNPSWEVPESEIPKYEALLNKQRSISPNASPAATGMLGYRGLIVTDTSESRSLKSFRAFDGVIESSSIDSPNYVDHGSEVEEFLINQSGSSLTQDEFQYITQELQKNVAGGIANSVKAFSLLAVPPFDPGKWNNNPTILRNNNCYNYANDLITNTFAQPGRGSGQEGPYPPSCAGTSDAAVRDGLIRIPNPNISPTEGQIVALVVSTTPGFLDYHWYRKDISGMWSHKPGQTAARNTDNSGQPITDPRECNRGPYNNFCGFFNAIPAKVRIR